MPPTERSRTTKACVACSIRKIKCDGNQPCAHCIRFFEGQCFYTVAKKRGPPKGCPPRGGHKKRQLDAAAAASSSTIPGPLPSPSSPTTTLPLINPLDAILPPPPVNGYSDMGITPGITPVSMDSHFDPGHFDAAGHFDPAGRLANDMTKLSLLSAASNSSVPSCSSSYATRAGLTSSAIDDLCLVYDTFIHPHWPIIYMPALRNLRVLETERPILFDACLAVSAAHTAAFSDELVSPPASPRGHFTSGTGRPMPEVSDDLTESVRLRILGCINSREFLPTLQMVQALILVSLIDNGCGRRSLGYQMAGFACRLAMDIGLHMFFPQQSPSSDGRNAQERSRTLWACFILDKMNAAISQRPPLLRLVDIDAPRPSVMERDELDLWVSGKAAQYFVQPHAREVMESVKSHCLTSFNSWCDIMAIVEVIQSEIYRPSTRRALGEGQHVDGYMETVAHIDGELRKWRESLPAHLQWSDDDPHAHENVGHHLLTCRGSYYISILLLHRPQVPFLDSPETPDHDPSENYSYARSRHADSYTLATAVDAVNHSATAICKLMEGYENTFRMRKFATSWIYLIYQAPTVHAGLAAQTQNVTPSLNRTESLRRLEQCIRWLDQISTQWSSAGRHVEILRRLWTIGARTRPPSPTFFQEFDLGPYVPPTIPEANPPMPPYDPGLAEAMNQIDIPLDINAWMNAFYKMTETA